MRAFAIVLAIAGLLALPVAAEGESICGCARFFAQDFNRSPKAHLNFEKVASEQGVSTTMEARIERGIYDWERGGYPRATFPWQRFCRRDELSAVVCRKLRNCLIAGGVQYAASLAAGSNRNEAAILAAGACATAVATT